MFDMEIHALFPSLLIADQNSDADRVKEVALSAMMKHLDADGYSDESTGHVTLHLDPMFATICMMATRLAKQYCEVMQVDPSNFDFNIVKTWFNIVRDRSTPFHNHGDAHLSFVYYINVPTEAAQPIQFYAPGDKYEPFPGFVRFNQPAEWNVFNSYAWQFPASEGTMYLFPSRMNHDTVGTTDERDAGVESLDDARTMRVAFAGDMLLTYKEKSAKSLGLQPKRNWRTFDGDLS
jgi:hypothetical protein